MQQNGTEHKHSPEGSDCHPKHPDASDKGREDPTFQADNSWGWPREGMEAVIQHPLEPSRQSNLDRAWSNNTDKPIKFARPDRNIKVWNADAT